MPEIDESNRLVIYSTRPLSITDNVLARFEADSGIDVTCVTLRTSDALMRIEAEQEHPYADVLWPATLATIQHKEELFSSVTTYSYAPTALMVNTDVLGDSKLTGYGDLLRPEYTGRIAFADPAVSSASFAHLVNMLFVYGNGDPEAGWHYVRSFCKQLNGRLLADDSEVFSGVANGYYTVGLTLAESSEEYAHSGAHVRTTFMHEGVMYHADAVCTVEDAPHADNADTFRRWLMDGRTQIYIQNAQYQTNTFSIDTVLEDAAGRGIPVIDADTALAAQKRNEWLVRFEALMAEQRQ